MGGLAQALPGRMARPPLLLREWGEPGYSYELRRVRLLYARLAAAHARSGPQVNRILELVESADRGALWLAGFGGGFVGGIQQRLSAWLDDIGRLLRTTLAGLAGAADAAAVRRALNLAGTAAAVTLDEFLRRPLVEAAPSGLSSATAESLQVLVDLHALGPQIEMLREIDSAARAIDFARLIDLAPETLADALAAAGAAWFSDLIVDESFESQGYRIGYPVGAGAVELIRMVAEPAWLDAAQLITVLDLSPAEQAAMGLVDGGGG